MVVEDPILTRVLCSLGEELSQSQPSRACPVRGLAGLSGSITAISSVPYMKTGSAEFKQ